MPVLIVAALGTQMLAALIVGLGFLVARIPWSYSGLIWGYCLTWVFIEDWAKLQVYHHFGLSAKRHITLLLRLKSPMHPHGMNADR